MAMTLIAPAVLDIRDEFDISYNMAQLVITAFLASMSIGLMFVGLISDRFGRRPVFLSGLALYFFSSLAGYFAQQADIVILSRTIQGLSAAALMTTGRVIANDLYKASDASRALSSITAIQSIVPVIALAVGGVIVSHFGWRATFGIMAGFSFLVFCQSLLLIAESNKNPLKALPMSEVIYAFRSVFASKYWQFYSLCAGMQIGMFYSMNGYMPYHFTRLGASLAEFGLYYATISFGYLIGNIINRHFGNIMSLGQWIICGSWITLIVLAVIWLGDEASLLSPLLLSTLLSLIGFAHGLLVANAIISSLVGAGQHTGTASGIGNAAHMIFGALSGSIIISLGGATSFWICIAINMVMAVISLWASYRGSHLES